MSKEPPASAPGRPGAGDRPDPEPTRTAPLRPHRRAAPPARAARSALGDATGARPAAEPSFIERYRTILVGAAIVAVVAIVGAGVFSTATSRPTPAPPSGSPDPTASPSRRRVAAARLRPAGHGQRRTSPPGQGDLHVLPTRLGPALRAAAPRRSARASTARTTPSSRRAGSTTSSTAAWSSCTRRRRACDEAGPAAHCSMRSRQVRSAASSRAARRRSGHRPLRRHDLALCRDRLGSRAAARDARPAGHHGLLPLGRAHQPGEALPDASETAAPSSSAAPSAVAPSVAPERHPAAPVVRGPERGRPPRRRRVREPS